DKTHAFHLWIDNWDPHEPWDPPSVWDKDLPCMYDPDYKGCDIWAPPMGLVKNVYTEEQLHHIRMLFAEKITLCDKYFGKLCDVIRWEGMEENTLVWLTSDHGEPLGNGEHGHGLICKVRPWPYEELVHIPLIIRFPGCPAGTRITAFAQDADCAPTILEWMGVPIPPNMTGHSLLPLIRGETAKVRDFAVAGYYSFSQSIITEEWNYIHWLHKGTKGYDDQDPISITGQMYASSAYTSEENVKALNEYKKQRALDGADQWTCNASTRAEVPEGDELYDRRTDPFQLVNVISEHPEVASELLNKLRTFMQDLDA
ncbi:MAG: sulfatase-like hydrolase/transferase, partial [Mailhella sp.]|nr:sulfatase-like hydrolase/transferase [Mailhella sp.]